METLEDEEKLDLKEIEGSLGVRGLEVRRE